MVVLKVGPALDLRLDVLPRLRKVVLVDHSVLLADKTFDEILARFRHLLRLELQLRHRLVLQNLLAPVDQLDLVDQLPAARKVSPVALPKRCRLARASLWEHSRTA